MAAEGTKGRKRKGAPDAAPIAKKAKKSDAAPAPKSMKSTKLVPDPKPSKSKQPRKQAADFFSDEEAPVTEPVNDAIKVNKNNKKSKASELPEPAAAAADVPVAEVETQTKPKKQSKKDKVVVAEGASATADSKSEPPADKPKKAKKGKKADPAPSAPVEDDAAAGAQEEMPMKKPKKSKSSKKQEEPAEEVPDIASTEVDGDGDVEEDGQIAALLAGFESEDEDENDPEDDVDFEDDVTVPSISKKARKELENAATGSKANQPGVIYVGRVPRGFFEPQMKEYFSQFGRVNRLRLSRNKQTGASKHYAFVEFASTEVADIVARTMDNYLLFGHILKCKLLPTEQVHPDLFKGAGQRFKVDPRNKKAGLEMERGVTREQWAKRNERENKRRTSKSRELKELFDYEYDAPNVKSVDEVPKQTNGVEGEEPQQLLEDASIVVPVDAPVEEAPLLEQPKVKKGKKGAKTNGELPLGEAVQPAPEKKSKKGTKAKAADDMAAPTEAGAEDVEPTSAPVKRSKKKAKTDVMGDAEPQSEAVASVVEAETEKKPKKTKKRKPDVAVENVGAADGLPVAAEVAPKAKKVKKEVKPSPGLDEAPQKKRKVKSDSGDVPKKARKTKA